MSQKEILGKNSLFELKKILLQHRPKSIFLVRDKASFKASGAQSKLDEILKGFFVTCFEDFNPNPELKEIKNGVNALKESKSDFVISVGGGSAIDMAKSINVLAENPGDMKDYISKKAGLKRRGSIHVAIPTTAGTGSESTHFAVVYFDKLKYSFKHRDYLIPNYAIIDPVLTESMPPYLTASTGMDALSQGIESYWSVKSTPISKSYAARAIRLAFSNLKKAVLAPSFREREAMAKAAHFSGKAINISETTAPHAISYPITSFFNVSHGHAVALTIPEMIVFNSQVSDFDLLDRRGFKYVQGTMKGLYNILGANTAFDAADNVRQLMDNIKLETKLSKLGISKQKDLQIIVDNGFNPERVRNNPRTITKRALEEMLLRIF